MRIKLLSDLHLEFNKGHVYSELLDAVGVDVLVLAGDIAVGPEMLHNALNVFAFHYPQVVYVPGNHEYYRHRISSIEGLNLPDNVHFLNPGVWKFQDVTFIGATLWTNFRNDKLAKHAAASMISDFGLISNFSPERASSIFKEHWSAIKFHYNENPGKKVIVTHFLPAVECIDPQYKNSGLLNNYFANDLGSDIADMSDVTWMYGHTHSCGEFQIGDTKLFCNPRGYPRENSLFNPNYVIEV